MPPFGTPPACALTVTSHSPASKSKATSSKPISSPSQFPPLPRISLISPLTSLLFYPLSHHIRGSFVFHGHLRLDHIPCLVPVQLSRFLASSSFFTISPPPFAGLPFFLGNIRRVRVRAGRILA
ncbi:hypothetical protein CBS147343_1331 [Aspergillus niger]|nr:hypothetical protein CBS11350_3951 [Aspergillus niger]KAI2861497.1 hypothetical protein CBS12448_4824 [Aspergillus niger]KAI2951971.1 hypothetical protein CBS147322_4841 [Aspergillus niger]KAI2973300.1 hypothetical protein CBS147324_4077 [Aspergillus niger]KAI2985727.1 hypothetical protein CBS147344_6012 [Aspergillus niger]